MKLKLSLKLFVTLALLGLGVLLVLGYSVLSAHYFMLGMDNIMVSHMDRAAHAFMRKPRGERDDHLSDFRGYQIAPRWELLPPEIREAFKTPPSEEGILYKQDDKQWMEPPDRIHFLMRFEAGDETLYVVNTVTRATSSKLVGRNAARSMRTLLTASAAILIAFALIIWLLLRRISRPVAALGNWTHALDAERLNQPPPDFSYPELNELAELIRTSLSSVQQSLEREHRFLRHASHELRTPISVVRNNLELMRRLQTTEGCEPDERLQQAVDRIDRASLTMQHLTETLLWLSREQTEALSRQQLSLDSLIHQLVEELAYLLRDKPVELELDTEPCELQLPEVSARIVLGNLIRNAFQHTWEGRVEIRQRGPRVEIINEQRGGSETDGAEDLGFGLGLELTAQLCARLGWDYSNNPGVRGHRAGVTLGPAVPPAQA